MDKPESKAKAGVIIGRDKKSKKRLVILITAVVLLLVIGGLVFVRLHPRKSASSAEPIDRLLQAEDNTIGKEMVVREYGTKYNSAIKEVERSDVTKWDKAMLDKAYLSLIYADKVGAFTQAQTALSFIELAGKQGLDVDDNSYGITKDMREAIAQRADALAQQTQQRSESGDERE